MVKAITGDGEMCKALQPVFRHITRQHYVLWLLKSIVTGLAGALLILTGARFLPLADSVFWAGMAGLACLCAGMVRAWQLRPGYRTAALAADNAGLKERATTAWQLRHAEDLLAGYQRRDALDHLSRLDYRQMLPWPRSKREFLLAAGLFMTVLAAALWPNPLDEVAQARKQAGRGLAEARQEVRQLQKQVQKEKQFDDQLKNALAKELTGLQRELARAKSVEEGAKALARREKELAAKLSQAERKAGLAQMARMLQENALTKEAGAALEKEDVREFQKKMSDLAAKLPGLNKEEQRKLAQTLDKVAPDKKTGGKQTEGKQTEGKKLADRLNDLKEQLAQELAGAAAADRMAQAVQQGLGQAKGRMLAGANQGGKNQTAMANGGQSNQAQNAGGSGGSNSGSTAGNNSGGAGQGSTGSTGNSGISSSSGNSSSGGNGSSGNGSGNSGSSGNGSGSGNSSSGSGQGSSGNSSGNGSGNGSSSSGSSGSGQGTGGAGQGSGGGAGTGSTNKAGGSFAAGGPGTGKQYGAAPDNQGRYEQIYVPVRLGGNGAGSQVQGAMGDSGDSARVDLDNAPVTGGKLLPYAEVLGQYQAEARESMDKQYVPENLQDMVKDYFVGLAQ